MLYLHGHEAEPHNYVDPKDLFLTERNGVKLKRTVLNEDLGAGMTRRVVNPLKQRNFLVGRLYRDGALWLNAFLRNWPWAIFAGLAFGSDVNTLESDGDVIQQHLDQLFPALFKRLLSPLPTWRWWPNRSSGPTC